MPLEFCTSTSSRESILQICLGAKSINALLRNAGGTLKKAIWVSIYYLFSVVAMLAFGMHCAANPQGLQCNAKQQRTCSLLRLQRNQYLFL